MNFGSCNTFQQIFLEVFTLSAFSDRLLLLRNQNLVRQADVASAAGVTVRGYQYYEKAVKEPTLSVLVSIADFYNVSIDYLVGRSDDPARR